jgi:hypothetical protein
MHRRASCDAYRRTTHRRRGGPPVRVTGPIVKVPRPESRGKRGGRRGVQLRRELLEHHASMEIAPSSHHPDPDVLEAQTQLVVRVNLEADDALRAHAFLSVELIVQDS